MLHLDSDPPQLPALRSQLECEIWWLSCLTTEPTLSFTLKHHIYASEIGVICVENSYMAIITALMGTCSSRPGWLDWLHDDSMHMSEVFFQSH